MAKIKKKQSNNKIDGKPEEREGCCANQMPCFSFDSMTRNSRYNLSKLNKGNEQETTILSLYNRLVEISSRQWKYWLSNGKSIGAETMSYDSIRFEANQNMNDKLSKDTTIYVFRFDTHRGSKSGRILGYKDGKCATLHIIGYDIDFSAYDHG